MAKFNTGQSFADGDTVTGAKLNNITSQLNIYTGVISEQTAMVATVSTADQLLIADTDNGDSGAANRITVQKLLSDSLTNGTYADVNLTGTITSNRTVATSATITTGTIPTLVSNNATIGTTTGTAGVFTSGTITTGLIPTLTAGTTTGTAGIFTAGTITTLNSTTGTIGSFNSTTGTIGSFNSTTGTIGNFTTTLAGDFTISSGTGTLATSGVTLGTYGDATSYPIVSVDAKGRVTTVSTAVAGSSVGTNSIYFAALSSSTSESTNVASRVAKGWVNFNGVADAIRSSFNVNSISHGTTGEYTVNFNTTIGTGMGFSADGNLSSSYNYVVVSDVTSATSLRITASDTSAAKTNLDYISVVVFGA